MNISQILRCPNCSARKFNPPECDACGSIFEIENGAVKLFTSTDRPTYSLPYISLREIKAVLGRTLRYPDKIGANSDVYHLDNGHISHFRNLPKGARVLEIGCGGAQMRSWVTALDLEYIGTDVAQDRVTENLQKFGGADFLSDAHNLPIQSETIDLVYSVAVTEHLAAPHLAMQEVYRVLKPGGIYLGNCSFMEPWHDDSFFHVSPNGVIAMLLSAKLEPVEVWPSAGYSGYQALLAMNNKATRTLKFLGSPMFYYSRIPSMLKLIIRKNYRDQNIPLDLARTAGAIDWVAKKSA